MPRIAVFGAHSELAKSLIALLEERELPVEIERYTTMEHIEDGIDPLSPESMERADLIVIAFRGHLARGLAEGAAKVGKRVLDVAGVSAGDAVPVWPVLDPEIGIRPGLIARIAPGLAGPLVSILRALAPFTPSAAAIVTFESAAAADKPGMDELADQIRAVYTMQQVETDVFDDRLAFSALPTLGLGERSFDQADDALRDDVAAGLAKCDAAGIALHVTRALVPAFTADAAMIHVDLDPFADRDAIAAALSRARGSRLVPGDPPTSSDAIDREDALVGRLRVEAGHLSLWVAADRLRGAAAAAVLAVEQWLGPKD